MLVVTGGAGFIGSNLVTGLAARGAQTIVCDFDDPGTAPNLEKRGAIERIPPEELLARLAASQPRPEAIFHMGATSSTVARDVDLVMRNNYLFSLRLWDWCASNDVRLIYASSAAVYGDGANGFDDAGDPETLGRLRPLNPYGWSKLLFDRAAAHMAAAGRRPPQWASLRFFNVYGPNEYHKGGQRSVVPQFREQIRETGRARLFRSRDPDYADGGQLRDFVHVRDAVSVMLWLLDTPGANGIFNLGTGAARSFDDMAIAIFDAMGAPRRIDYIDMPDGLRNRYQYFTQARIDRLRAAGYDQPFTSLEDGVRSYVQDHLETNDPYV